jgi:hypothetical protein
MGTNELVRRIDESIETAKKILAAQLSKGADRTEAPDGMKMFCQGIKGLIEDVYGDSNHLSGKFEVMDGYNPAKVEEGLKVLKDLRSLIAYSGEFGS